MGEGWHNYHHVFPWDYKAAELGNYGLNWTTMFLDFFRNVGQVYDAKFASSQLIKAVVERRGEKESISEISEKILLEMAADQADTTFENF